MKYRMMLVVLMALSGGPGSGCSDGNGGGHDAVDGPADLAEDRAEDVDGTPDPSGEDPSAPDLPDEGDPCTPETCETLEKDCGTVDNGCGDSLECGDCEEPETCGGGGVPNVCGRAGTLLGVGWTGSTSLVDYPKTGEVTEGCPIVEIDDGLGGESPAERLEDALLLLEDNDCVLLRDNSDATVVLAERIRRTTAWSGPKQVLAYGSQRIRIDASGLAADASPLTFDGSADEHWKGFEIVGTAVDTGAVVNIGDSTGVIIEDFWVHDNPTGTPIRITGGSDDIVQDCVAWHNGIPGIVDTNVPDGYAGTVFTTRSMFVRCVAINGNDDGFDFWSADNSEFIDCVAVDSGHTWDGGESGDGGGFKMGGESTAGGGNAAIGCIAVDSAVIGVNWNSTAGDPLTIIHNTSARNNTGFWMGGKPHQVTLNISSGNTRTGGSVNGGQDSIGEEVDDSWNCWNTPFVTDEADPSPDPLFADPDNGDFSLLPGSPYIHAGPDGETLGASEIALQLLKDNWTRR
jgi:hypothetical protein